MGLPLNAHALLVCTGPLDLCRFILLGVLLQSVGILRITKGPNPTQDQTTLVALFGKVGRCDALFENLNGFVGPLNTVQRSTLVEEIASRSVSIFDVLLQQIQFPLNFCRFVAACVFLQDLVRSKLNALFAGSLPIFVARIFTDPGAIHSNDTHSMLLCKRQTVLVMQDLWLLLQ